MKKRFCNIAFGFIFCLVMAFVLCPVEIQANTNGFETDSDGYKLIHTYEELRRAASEATWEDQYRLANDIDQIDSKNDYKLDMNGNYLSLDLNGYKISRSTASTDNALFRVMNDAVLEIRDSSENGTGGCYYKNRAASRISVINNTGGALYIYGGTFDIPDVEGVSTSILQLESGETFVEGGCLGTKDTKVDYSIILTHQNMYTETPVCYISDGTFYAHYGNISISPVSTYLKFGCLYSTAYVIGGEFYLNNKSDNSAGFANCNNGWGDVIVASGKIPLYWLNKGHISADQVKFIPEVTKNYIKESTGTYTDGYQQVTAPAKIVSHDLWYNERLLNDAVKTHYERYTADSMKNSEVYKQHGAYMEEFMASMDTIEVGAYDNQSPELWIEGLQSGDTVSWYGTYDINGKWSLINGHEHDTEPWRFDFRPDGETFYYVKAEVKRADGSKYEDVILIHYDVWTKTLQGNAKINRNNVRYGNTVYADVFDTPSWQDISTYLYEWKVDGVTVGSGSSFAINRSEYVGKQLTCTITSSKYDGSLVTPAVTIGRITNDAQPVFPDAFYNTASEQITLYNVKSTQEYLFTTKKNADELTEDDWKDAKHPESETSYFSLFDVNMQEYKGKTIYVHARYEMTDITEAGTKVVSRSVKLADIVYLDTIHFADEVNGTVYIPFTEKGQSVTLKYSLDPINANQWNTFTWVPTSWPVKILFPESGVTPDQNNDGRLVLSLQAVGGTTLIANTSNGSQFKKLKIVVYDPKNPSIGTANVVRPMPDLTVELGTFFTPEMPEFIPEIPESMELFWYFTESTQSGLKTYRTSLVGDIVPETGQIYTMGTGTAEVSLVKKEGNSFYALDTFKLTVVEYEDYVPVERIDLSRNNVALQINDTLMLNAKVVPSNASNIEEVWNSSDSSIVKVDQNGQLIGMKEGTAKVTVTIDGKKASCNVTVTKNPVFNGGEEVPPQENPFTDVKETDYFFEPVLWAVDQGITTGTSKTAFSPEAICTRAQAVTFLWRSIGQPEPKSNHNPFSDVKSSEYYYKAVLWAVENGITNGVSATQFKPDDYCTRGQIVTFLWRLNGLPTILANNPFKDVLESEYYYKAVLWAVNKNITNGTTPNTFEPNSKCTRGQIVTFLYRSESN